MSAGSLVDWARRRLQRDHAVLTALRKHELEVWQVPETGERFLANDMLIAEYEASIAEVSALLEKSAT